MHTHCLPPVCSPGSLSGTHWPAAPRPPWLTPDLPSQAVCASCPPTPRTVAAVKGRCYRLRARSATCPQRQLSTVLSLLVNAPHSEPDLSGSVLPDRTLPSSVSPEPRARGLRTALMDPHSWGRRSVGQGRLSPRLSKPVALGAGTGWTAKVAAGPRSCVERGRGTGPPYSEHKAPFARQTSLPTPHGACSPIGPL